MGRCCRLRNVSEEPVTSSRTSEHYAARILLGGKAECEKPTRIWNKSLGIRQKPKLNPRSSQFNFTGLGEDSKSFRYDGARTWKILTSCDVIFSVEMLNGD